MKSNIEQAGSAAKKGLKIGCLSIVGFLVIVILFNAMFGEDTPKIHTSEAYVVSKSFVKTQLAFPEEAEFSMLPHVSEIQENTDSLYRVVSDVTFKNAFGVKSKKRYLIRMKFKGGDPLNPSNWEVHDFNF